MYVKEYSKKLDGAKNLTPNFKVREFACNDGSDYLKIDLELLALLQLIRDIVKNPLNINSGYRTAKYNKKVGGASNSYHLYGRAFDVSGIDSRTLAILCNSLGIKGIIKYDSFVHMDSRDTIYHANYGGSNFFFESTNITYQNKLVYKGMNNYLVGCVQFRLKIKGYDVGNCDSIFGNKTYNALVKFQKDVFPNDSKQWDGVVGVNTWNKLFN